MNQDAEIFLKLLTEGESCTFQTFDESRLKRRSLNKILHGDLNQHCSQLESLNQKGAGVFVMVNRGDLRGRRNQNVKSVRAVFVDLDGSPVEPVMKAPLLPHVTVESSAKRFHAYWLVNDIRKDEFRTIQEMLALRFDGDASVKDLPRVMRLPGFLHQKNEPYLTNILHTNKQKRFKRDDFFDAFNFDSRVSNWKDKQPICEGQRNNKLFSMACGFVSKGLNYQSVFERIYKINEDQCKPPLEKSEVQQITQSALQAGSTGEVRIDYHLFDSPKYSSLSPRAKALDLIVRRMTKGNTQTIISLLPRDIASRGFGNPKTLAKYRDELLEQNFLIQHQSPRYGRNGETRECGLYKLGEPGLYGKTYHKKH